MLISPAPCTPKPCITELPTSNPTPHTQASPAASTPTPPHSPPPSPPPAPAPPSQTRLGTTKSSQTRLGSLRRARFRSGRARLGMGAGGGRGRGRAWRCWRWCAGWCVRSPSIRSTRSVTWRRRGASVCCLRLRALLRCISWTGPPRGERTPRVGIGSTVFGVRALCCSPGCKPSPNTSRLDGWLPRKRLWKDALGNVEIQRGSARARESETEKERKREREKERGVIAGVCC